MDYKGFIESLQNLTYLKMVRQENLQQEIPEEAYQELGRLTFDLMKMEGQSE